MMGLVIKFQKYFYIEPKENGEVMGSIKWYEADDEYGQHCDTNLTKIWEDIDAVLQFNAEYTNFLIYCFVDVPNDVDDFDEIVDLIDAQMNIEVIDFGEDMAETDKDIWEDPVKRWRSTVYGD